MIAIKLEGRLGNQLFQYAFIYTLAKKLRTSFYLDKSIDNFLLPKYFDIQQDFLKPIDKYFFSINGFKNIFRYHLKIYFYNWLYKLVFKKRLVEIDNIEYPADVLKKVQNGIMYKGYFQSELYFKPFTQEIKTLFKIRKKYVDEYQAACKSINSSDKRVVIHIRRTDYIDLNMALPVDYFHNAIRQIDEKNALFVFISDDPTFVESEFTYITNKYISRNNEIIDFQFLMDADICIISNSSFSWWGAYLNNKNTKVYAPKYWFVNTEDRILPVGIHIDNWIKI